MKSSYLQQKSTFLITTLMIVAVIGISFCYSMYLQKYLSITSFHIYKTVLQDYVIDAPLQAHLIYFFLYFFLVAGFLPAGALLNLIGGFLFSTPTALFLANSAATLGACCNLLMVRYFLQQYVHKKYQAQLAAFNKAYHHNHVYYLLSVRIAGIFPFPVVNTLTGLTSVSLWTYCWTTCLGILPGQTLFIIMGKQLGAIHHISDILTPQLFIIFLLLAALFLLPTYYKTLQIYDCD